ncbi:hypothetical protein TELCIR_20770, partial [Teladorsagia circumcincta]
MSGRQKDELSKRGYTFMEQTQMQKLHEEQSLVLPYSDGELNKGHLHKYTNLHEPEIKSMVADYGTLSREQRQDALWEAIAKIAGLDK